MPTSRGRFRGVVLCEDGRSRRFYRCLLQKLGLNVRRFTFLTAPSGKGSGEAWVRKNYPTEVRVLRSKGYQKGLCLVAARDGDSAGVARRKQELVHQLDEDGQKPRSPEERIATPVSTWSIETWLLALLGAEAVDESMSLKRRFEREYADEGHSIEKAARNWLETSDHGSSVPSLADGREELNKILAE